MQPLRQLDQTLRVLADREHCVFAASDLAAAVPGCGQLAVLLSRAAKAGLLRRVCKGIYFYPVKDYPAGNLLHHAAARRVSISAAFRHQQAGGRWRLRGIRVKRCVKRLRGIRARVEQRAYGAALGGPPLFTPLFTSLFTPLFFAHGPCNGREKDRWWCEAGRRC